MAGGACMTVALDSAICLISRRPSTTVSGAATTTRAPTVSGKKSSKTAMSKQKVVIANRRPGA